jgi:hypothetical protein
MNPYIYPKVRLPESPKNIFGSPPISLLKRIKIIIGSIMER